MPHMINVRNPRSGKTDYHIKRADTVEIETLAKELRSAQQQWLERGLENRIAALTALKAAIAAEREALIDAVTTDTGRHKISVMEVDGLGRAIDRWINVARNCTSEEVGRSAEIPSLSYRISRVPYTLIGVISPWNFPLTLAMIDALPALLAGSAVIIKPSEITPRFAEPLRRALNKVDYLRDVISIVDGDGETGAALIGQVDAVCFTGSVATGRKVAEAAARHFIPAFLELGGKDPALVLDDADIDQAATALLRASILNSGQACQSIERIYVARPIHDDFLTCLVAKAKTVKFNYPDIRSGHIGPLIFARQAEIIADQFADARRKGATFHCGGEIEYHGGGVWCPPTVITGLTDDMTVMTDETFGPIMPLLPFDTEEEAIEKANATEYGLSAAVFSRDLRHAEAVARRIDAGAISMNDAALTGLMHEAEKNSFKLSGMGGSRMGVAGYTRFFRKKALITNSAAPFAIEQFDESEIG